MMYVDKDRDDWKRSLIKHHFTGVQLTDPDGFIGLATIYCKVLWVPDYVIADRNGRIIHYDAPQAVNPMLKSMVDDLLKRSKESGIGDQGLHNLMRYLLFSGNNDFKPD